MKVEVDIAYEDLEGDHGNTIEGVVLTCGKCGHSVEVFGTGEASIKRGCVMLREECPNGERNFYEAEE